VSPMRGPDYTLWNVSNSGFFDTSSIPTKN
jgi:hypothetical protein